MAISVSYGESKGKGMAKKREQITRNAVSPKNGSKQNPYERKGNNSKIGGKAGR